MEPTKEKNIAELDSEQKFWQKMFNVQQAVQTVIKGGTNANHGYKYAREIDIISEIKPLLKEQRLVITSTTNYHERIGEKNNKISVEFTIRDVDCPSCFYVANYMGMAEDKAGSNVGLPIAYTMALKYFLSKTFLVETGDDVEAERKKGKGGDESTEAKFEKAKLMILKSSNVDGLIDYSETLRIKKSSFNDKQKKELNQLLDKRISELTPNDKD